MTYLKGREIIKKTAEDIKDQLRKGKVKIDKVYRELQRQEKKQEFINTESFLEFPKNSVKLSQGDFMEKSNECISDGSIDLLFTDPPYGFEYLTLYDNLAQLAVRVLKNGGSLVTYVGNYSIPQIIDKMLSAGLKYWWTMAIILSASFARHYPRKVSIKWKWFVKGDATNAVDFIADVINSIKPPNVMHEWEQSRIEAEHVISRLTIENQTYRSDDKNDGVWNYWCCSA